MRNMSEFSQIEDNLFHIIGSYARSVRYTSRGGHLCPVCGGLKDSLYSCCAMCKKLYDQAHRVHGGVADIVRIGYYAPKYTQMYSTMFNYKDFRENDVRVIVSILADTLITHYTDMVALCGSVPTAWATIPSHMDSKRFGKPHPLNIIMKSVMKSTGIPELTLECVTRKSEGGIRKGYDNTAFVLSLRDEVDLSHVLLVDDSWTSGHSIQSTAGAVKLAGAQFVTAYCIARIIDEDFWKHRLDSSIIEGFNSLSFEPHNPWL